MKKVSLNPGDLLAPLPCVMVSLGDKEKSNIITIAWTGIINSTPPMTYISVRPSRYSYNILKETKEFVINLCNEDLAYAMDYCGNTTGAKIDKFKEMHLTKSKASLVSCPMIKEAPLNIECKVTEIKHLGSHDMFLAEIVAVHANEDLMQESGRLALEKANLTAYMHGEYFGMKTRRLGTYGYSVMKPSTAKKRRSEGKSFGGKKPHFYK
ncbi:MAG: flavin reductase family protein [Clostridia bacterium]|nr:flavin reductase family protein [Clostridia bacterium]